MKMLTALALVVLMLALTGCGSSSATDSIEKRIAALESQNAQLSKQLEEINQKLNTPETAPVVPAEVNERLDLIEEHLTVLDNMFEQPVLPQSNLVGTWKGERFTYIFYPDETVTEKYDSGHESTHIYSTDGIRTLIIKYNEGHLGSIEYRYSIEGDILTITGASGGRETFTRVK